MVWFAFLAIVGVVAIGNDWSVLAALNPYYGIKFLFSPNNARRPGADGHRVPFDHRRRGAVLGYGPRGPPGNIYFTWPFIKVALVLNYFGQGAWMLRNQNNPELARRRGGINPFFQMMDPNVRYVAVRAVGHRRHHRLPGADYGRVHHGLRGHRPQLDAASGRSVTLPVPAASCTFRSSTWVLCVATLAVLLLFRDSEHISAAYGLALTITMITTTILLGIYLWHRSNKFGAVVFTIVFLAIQVLFFAASMAKFLAWRLVHAAAHAGDSHGHVHVE